MTTLILTRHGEVEGINPPRFRGRLELHLTTRGEQQARRLGEVIVGRWKVDALFSSPAWRCVATASRIGDAASCPSMPLSGLLDISYGAWQGLTHDEVRERWPDAWRMWREAPHLAAIPGAETLQDVLARATAALREVMAAWHNKTVVLVAHDSVNRVLLCHLLDVPLSRYTALAQDPCCINVIELHDTRVVVRAINETQHLVTG